MWTANSVLLDTSLALLSKKPSAQAACLHALGKALEASHTRCGDVGESHPEFYLRKRLYDAVGVSRHDQSTTAYLFGTLLKPIDEVRNGAYHLLGAMVTVLPHFAALALFQVVSAMQCPIVYPSLEDLVSRPNYSISLTLMHTPPHLRTPATTPHQAPQLRTYWFERTTEFTKEGREWKFALLQALQRGPALTDLSPQDVRAVSKYVKQGPFYSEARFEDPAVM